MKLIQLNSDQLPLLEGRRFLIVESQEYGQPSDFLFNVAVSAETADAITSTNDSIRTLTDNGRTVGFWQRLGGSGIFRPDLVALQGFSHRVTEILAKRPHAKISYEGKTWLEIIRSMPNFTPDALSGIDADKDAPSSTKTKSKKRATKKAKATK